jgi:hypothetical protein
MALQPVGPLPPSTYWRRRVLLAVVAVVLLLVGLKACTGDDDEQSLASRTTPSPTPSPTVSTAPSGSRSAAPTTTSSPSPAPVPACGDAALQVTVESDAEAYKSGAAPRFTLSVTNVGPTACRRALGPSAVELRVFSGEDRIWSSDDCAKGTGQGILELAPKEARQLTVQWPGKRTKPGCKTSEVAQPGTYRVSARVGGIVRQGSVFRITG